ncbi:hypothetical protein PM033_17585 [Halorubrum ezzemoulense]|uniref:hypothetical protein n=1 Tax=Halorubrum ezzemoulense TaxID=337243 RepID=UPI00232C95F1|nr:hypothetical protein [Halorubrum ezzemoulense]MDB2253531.1 hypothetical protein [Halorubrum ezzemoulense]
MEETTIKNPRFLMQEVVAGAIVVALLWASPLYGREYGSGEPLGLFLLATLALFTFFTGIARWLNREVIRG